VLSCGVPSSRDYGIESLQRKENGKSYSVEEKEFPTYSSTIRISSNFGISETNGLMEAGFRKEPIGKRLPGIKTNANSMTYAI
jgi:hypothetical protein